MGRRSIEYLLSVQVFVQCPMRSYFSFDASAAYPLNEFDNRFSFHFQADFIILQMQGFKLSLSAWIARYSFAYPVDVDLHCREGYDGGGQCGRLPLTLVPLAVVL